MHRSTSAMLGVVLAAGLVVAGCGDDDDVTTDTTPTSVDTGGVTTTPSLDQPAVWPAAGVDFATPEEAATDFVEQVLGVPAELGSFEQGDARSGEIEVLSTGEGGGTQVARGVLFLRQIGPSDGWFVIGAGNDNATVTTPETLATVPAGPLTVEGVARGFEANVVVTAFLAGDHDAVLDQAITMGGAFETPEPYSVTLDLSDASPGDTVAILVRGGTGLETDPGEFGAIVVTIG